MKKFLCLLSLIIISSLSANAVTFDQAVSGSKPAAVLIYADWADDAQGVLQSFNAMGQQYNGIYNFVPLNICKPEAKDYNKTYYIYPNLPYVMLFKNGGKINRYLKKDCFMDASCFKDRLDVFNI